MARKKEASGRPQPIRLVPTDADVEALLDEIDQATIDRDEARLGALSAQLWTLRRQAPEVLTRRVIEGRARVPALAFELLGGVAGAKATSYLKRIAENDTVADIVRFGARRRMGWAERGEVKQRLRFLATLKDAEGTLVEAVAQGTSMWPPDGQVLEEVLRYLAGLASEERRRVLAGIVAELDLQGSWLLHGALHIDDPATQRLVLAELVKMRDPGAAGAVQRLAKTASRPEIRAEAAASLQRLAMRPVDRKRALEFPPFPPVERAFLSTIDGDGGQGAVVIRKWGPGALLLVTIFHNDHWGVKETFGVNHVTDDQVDETMEGLRQETIGFVEVGLEEIRGALALAVPVNAASGHGLPPSFELWEPLLHESYPPPGGEGATTVELDDAPYANRPDLLQDSDLLYDLPFFDSWVFDPSETLAAMLASPAPKTNRWTDHLYRALTQHLVDQRARDELRRRLRRQAWLLEKDGDGKSSQIALAVAARLATATPNELAQMPFLRNMIRFSVESVIASATGDLQ